MTTSTERGNFTDTLDKPFSVTLWGSNPDETDNDDCWTGENYATRDEAIQVYRALCGSIANEFGHAEGCALDKACGHWEFVEIDGPDVHEVTANPDQKKCRAHRRELARSDDEWRRERAMQAGMAFGCDGYNDEMGW